MEKITPTAGAMRAAQLVYKRLLNPPTHTTEELAEIIDRETGAGELLTALNELLAHYTKTANAFRRRVLVDDEAVVISARKAIAKTKGA